MTSQPMSRDEITDLLTWVQAVDGHDRGRPDVAVWMDAADRGRWTTDAALAAVREIGRTFTGYRVMPGHVDERIRAERATPPRQQAIEGPSVPAAGPETVAAVVSQVSRKLGWDHEIDHRTVMSQRCGWCGAQPGEQCTRVSKSSKTGRVPCKPHPCRREVSEAAAGDSSHT